MNLWAPRLSSKMNGFAALEGVGPLEIPCAERLVCYIWPVSECDVAVTYRIGRDRSTAALLDTSAKGCERSGRMRGNPITAGSSARIGEKAT